MVVSTDRVKYFITAVTKVRHRAPAQFFFFRSSESNFPPANFGSVIEVILEYLLNRSSDQLAGGVERKGLIPRVGGCPICRSPNFLPFQ